MQVKRQKKEVEEYYWRLSIYFKPKASKEEVQKQPGTKAPCNIPISASFLETVKWWLTWGEKENQQEEGEEDTEESEEWKHSILISRKRNAMINFIVLWTN